MPVTSGNTQAHIQVFRFGGNTFTFIREQDFCFYYVLQKKFLVISRPVTRVAKGVEAPLENISPPWKNVLDII